MAINISFGGASIDRPGAYSTVDTSSMTPVTVGALRALAFVGKQGTSGTLTGVAYFNNEKDAAAKIGTGELLDMMKVAWQHGADLICVAPVIAAASTPTDGEWQTAIDLLQSEFVDGIVPVTTTPAIHVKIDTHITAMSSILNRKRRRGFYGHATGMDTTAIVALQTALNTERGIMASPGVYMYDADGNKVLRSSQYLAAAYAGIWASQSAQVPLTYKYVKFPGLEKIYTGPEISALLAGHIAPVESVRNKGYRIVHGQTLAASADLTQNELSVSSLKDVMSADIESHFEEKYVGRAGEVGIEVTIYNDLISKLEGFLKLGWISGYVQDSVNVTKNGTTFTLDWEGKPTLPINNFLNTARFTL